MRRYRVLHAIHDFLPRHHAGSEIYAHDLASEQVRRGHDVWVLAAEYDPAATHGTLRWRRHGSLPIVELVNNWAFHHFEETYASPRLNEQLSHVLAATQPDVVHIHNLLNLSLDLPRLARERGAAVAATLHDYTLVCIAGGQRIHRAERHVCTTIDPDRCARCFAESPFGLQFAAGRLTALSRMPGLLRAAAAVRRAIPVSASAVRAAFPASTTVEDVRRRLAYAKHVFDMVDLFVAPSVAIRDEYVSLGAPPERIEVSGYGHAVTQSVPVTRTRPYGAPRIGYVGSIVWHKGLHVLLAAARQLDGAFTLTVHGSLGTDPSYTADMQSAAAGLPVRFAGAFDRENMAAIYGTIDVLVVPSIWPENAPLVVQEARRYGIPVVASRIGGLPEFVDDEVDGRLFAPGAVDELRRLLQVFVDDPARLTPLSDVRSTVKTIDSDATEWERRYATLTSFDSHSNVERRLDAARAAGCDRSAEQAS
ncbi:MAG TPA: glycosyltransferase [Vicinamibacterales bacterium]|jgi:glycosyltransferase involved in cell wall biosynthesis|nr:glycosyltransferase [Vicinamibacterales bacterium]